MNSMQQQNFLTNESLFLTCMDTRLTELSAQIYELKKW